MDPEAALEELLTLVDQVIRLSDHAVPPRAADVRRIAELVDALDGWLVVGGFVPRRWAGGQR